MWRRIAGILGGHGAPAAPSDHPPVAADSSLPPLEHLQLLLGQLDARLESQRDAWDGLERKGTTMLGSTGVLLGLVVSNAKTFQTYPEPAPAVYLGALAVLVAGLVAGVVMIWPREYKEVPEPGPLLGYADKASDYTVGVLLSTKAAAYEANLSGARWKLWAVRAQMVLLAVAGGLLFIVLVIGRS